MMNWVAIDVETTGIKEGHLIELGAVTRAGQKFHCYVFNLENKYESNPYVLNMHCRIWKKLATIKPSKSCFEQEGDLFCWEGLLLPTFQTWLASVGLPGTYNAAGKNVKFDLDWLAEIGRRFNQKSYARYRALDPAILYLQEGDECLPDLSTCAERIGMKFEVHSALDDAEVVRELLIRKGF